MNAKAYLIFCATVLLIASNARAIGISPSRTTLNFAPNITIPLYINVINNGDGVLSAHLYVRGDLASFVQFPNSTTDIYPKSRQRFNYTLTMPSSLAGPKTYNTRIGAVEVQSGDAMVGAVVGVEAQLWVFAPTGEGWSPANSSATQTVTLPKTTNQTQIKHAANQSSATEFAQYQPRSVSYMGGMLLITGGILALLAILAFARPDIFTNPTKTRKRQGV